MKKVKSSTEKAHDWWYGNSSKGLIHPIDGHVAGQRCERASNRRMVTAKLQKLYDELPCPNNRRGVLQSALVIGIKLKETT